MSTTNASKTINVTDAKPGWIDVLMGADNVETNTTVTATNTVTNEQKTDETITNTVTMVSAGEGDSYSVNLYFDNFSQTIVPVSPDFARAARKHGDIGGPPGRRYPGQERTGLGRTAAGGQASRLG